MEIIEKRTYPAALLHSYFIFILILAPFFTCKGIKLVPNGLTQALLSKSFTNGGCSRLLYVDQKIDMFRLERFWNLPHNKLNEFVFSFHDFT
jgi:hypothetical protein